MGNEGPILIDSLDKPNATPSKTPSQKPIDPTSLVLGILTIVAILLVLLFVWIILRLRYEAEYNLSQPAIYLLWLLYAVPVIVVVLGLFGGIYYGLLWLRSWAKKNDLVSAQTGPHYKASDIRANYTDDLLIQMVERMYNVMEERARQSTYQGVQTLTQTKNIKEAPKDTAANALNKAVTLAQEESLDDLTK